MGFDNDCILNIQSLAGEYFCPVCHLLVYPSEALQAQCTHLYCKPCLTYVVSTTHACPYDGYRVTEADSKPLLESNQALGDTIGKIQVHCLYYRTGCTWEGSLSDCTSHCSTCGFGESPVQCNRCGIQIVHRQVQEHAQNCPGVQTQPQTPGVVQNSSSAGSVVASDQGQINGQTVAPSSQAHATQASVSSVSTQDINQQTSSAMQPLAAQAALPTPEQWYQQQQQYQQQYQQYYQQYPAYDPYQQQYQYYYQYPQEAQPYQQPSMQAYTSQAYGQTQSQPQLHAQQQGQVNVQSHPQPQPQAPSQPAQAQPQPQSQPAVNSQPQVQSAGHAQPQMQAQSQGPLSKAVPYNQTLLLSQGQSYAQQQPVPQQMPVSEYQQAHPQMQHSYPLPYPQSQTQQYPHAQSQAQPHYQLAPQAAAYPPRQVDQPMNPNAQFQPQNTVSGYQSYPQPQLHPQAQVGAAHQMPTGVQQKPQYQGQMQGKFPQASQSRLSQNYAVVPNQQQPAHGQAPSGPSAQQLPVFSHAQQAAYPFQQRPGVQAFQQAQPQQYMQQQSIPGQGAFVQTQIHPQGPSQIQSQIPQQHQQNYAPSHGAQPDTSQIHGSRQMVPQSAGSQPYAQAAGTAGPGHVTPMQSQTYPIRTNSQMSASSEQHAFNGQNSSKTSKGDMLHGQTEDGVQNQNNYNEEEIGVARKSAVLNQVDKRVKSDNDTEDVANGDETIRDMSLSSASELPGTNQVSTTQSKPVERGVQECKPGTIENTTGRVSEPSSGGSTNKGQTEDTKDVKKAEVHDLKRIDRGKVDASVSGSVLPQSHLPFQGHGLNSFAAIDQVRPQLQAMQYGPSGQQRPGLASMPQSMPHQGNHQQSGLRGHPTNQLRPQGGQVYPQPPFNAADNFQPPILKHPAGAHEKPPVGILGPGSSGPFGGPGSVGHYQGHVPPYQAGQHHNLQSEPFMGPSLAAQRPKAFDPHVQQGPLCPLEIEKFPMQRSGYFDDGLLDSHIRQPAEQGPYGSAPFGVRPVAVKPSGPLAHDLTHSPGLRDERLRPFHEEHFKPFSHRDVEEDLRKFPGPPHLDAGPSKIRTQFPSSGALDQGPLRFGVDGLLRPFGKGPRELDCDSRLKIDSGVGCGPSIFFPPLHPNDVGSRAQPEGLTDDMSRPEFGRRPGSRFGQPHVDGLPPRSPGIDYPGFCSRTLRGYRDINNNESLFFEDSRRYNFPGEPFRKSARESRFPVLPNHFHKGELDVPTNLRMGDHFHDDPHNRDMLAGYSLRSELMGTHNLHLGKGTASSRSAGPSRLGEPPLARSFPHHVPLGEAFGGEKPGHLLAGGPAYRSSHSFQRSACDVGFYPCEQDSFDHLRKRKPGNIMCRICKVECGTVEGLDLHSQTREHQRKAVDMVRSIKHQNKKKILKDQAIVEGGAGEKPKSSSFESSGHKR